ncbi:glycine zipper 2TM domain-containing protein [Ideonella azotifigens]|uniref:Glycine zipper 2TM domain-containing protein n=1 Tax=Ideonella azotifigens TaxID=513160 RepID=A0ABN1JS95_9BURK|nr:glycine zipper 2TM domain-containing protein [Ideonella azotifigens]MCD2340866.1 glycine zipper 2TM domain-containing protein [Ideonella azotifigens]
MSSSLRLAAVAALSASLISLTACAGMSNQTRDTAVGAGLGAIAGSVITGGTTGGAVAGGVIGGVIGNENSKK